MKKHKGEHFAIWKCSPFRDPLFFRVSPQALVKDNAAMTDPRALSIFNKPVACSPMAFISLIIAYEHMF